MEVVEDEGRVANGGAKNLETKEIKGTTTIGVCHMMQVMGQRGQKI